MDFECNAPTLRTMMVRILRSCTATLQLAAHESKRSPPTGRRAMPTSQVVAECSLLARTTGAIPAPKFELARLQHELVAQLETAARPQSLPGALLFDPVGTPDHAFAHVQLSCLGSVDPAIDELLCGAWAASESRGLERATATEIEATWLHAIWQGDSRPPFTSDLLARSALGHPLDALRSHRARSHELARTVLQTSDLGTWPVNLPRPRAVVIADVEVLLGQALAEGDHAEIAELLWAWPMLRLPWTDLSTRAFALLIDVYGRRGFPDYHATWALGILISTVLSVDWLPDAAQPWTPQTLASAYAATLDLHARLSA